MLLVVDCLLLVCLMVGCWCLFVVFVRCLLFVGCCLLLAVLGGRLIVVRNSLSVVRCPLFVARGSLLFVISSLPIVLCYVFFVVLLLLCWALCLLFVVRCPYLLFVVCRCSLFVDGCLLVVV